MIAPRQIWESTRKDKWPGFGVQKFTSQAIGEGRLKLGPCVICGALGTHAHHPDYANPLYVISLCQRHHSQLHKRLGALWHRSDDKTYSLELHDAVLEQIRSEFLERSPNGAGPLRQVLESAASDAGCSLGALTVLSTENGIQKELPKTYETPFGPVIEETEITTVAQANEAHHRISGLFPDALGLGKFLFEQKEKVGHSNWEQWVKDKLEFTSRTASRYMLLYNERNQFATEQIGHALSDLSMRKALKILAGHRKREKAKIVAGKETAKVVSMQETEDSKGAYRSSTSYNQFKDAIALLNSLDAKDYRYSQWIERLQEVISDMKSKVSSPQQEAA